MGVSELRKLRQLEEENQQLKKLVADLSLDKQMLQDFIKKVIKPTHKKKMALWMVDHYQISKNRACKCVLLCRSIFFYKHNRRAETALKMRIREIASTRIRYGFKRIYTLLRREGFTDNHKRVYRIYRAEDLNLRSKRPRRNRSANHRLERLNHQAINQVWNMDFSRSGKPTNNPYVESINGKFRVECLNANWFLSLEDAAKKMKISGGNTTISVHTAQSMI